MPSLYKTPGVYVEEIPKFPPSIAPVETAIPAFIGYTEKASRNGEPLLKKPVRIESIAEYEEVFGGAPSQAMTVFLDNDNAFVKAEKAKGFLLYDSLRMFYANGGGNCYIVSVGSYSDMMQKTAFENGIDAIENEDEPTMLLFPDAVNLSNASDLHDLQIKALGQCNKLKDRVTLCDLTNSGTFSTDVQTLRNSIGINNLKYGAAYGPWIVANLPRTVSRRDLTLKRNNTEIDLKSLATEDAVLWILNDVLNSETAVNSLKSGQTAAVGSGKTLDDGVKAKSDAYDASTDTTLATLEDELRGIYDIFARLLASINTMKGSLPTYDETATVPALSLTKSIRLKSDIEQYITNMKLKDTFDVLAAHYNYLKVTNTEKIALFTSDPDTGTSDLGKAIALLGYLNSAAFKAITKPEVTAAYIAATTEKAKANLAKNAAMNASSAILAFYRFAQTSAAEYEKKFNDSLLNAFSAYKNIVTKASEYLNMMPPCAAIAGVYAAVDRDRGVWKAPANVSLNSVVRPAVKISQDQQGEYNVDVNAGKSINIIRSFTGKGVLVWGARTLAGNDNEWRYVSVRRFFNFVEESTKKATEQFVFEPNDANTWVRIQAMIENFLTVLWRQGALQGIKPEHAFYVAVGLGKTMTALDILEGRLIIEIGMAAVRPAEFIILKFSHKMAES
jgi:phage tail sheath protein FI